VSNTTIVGKKRERPEEKLEVVLAKNPRPEEIKVHKTTIHVGVTKAEDTDQEPLSEGSALFRPTDEQVAKINEFTRSPKTADELAVFPTHACNTLWDRDDDRFTARTLKDFDTKDAPFSPVGKSFLIGHNHNSLPVGRIFDKSIQTLEGDDTYLETWQYIPNTEQYAAYLENLDFGIFWAVSVGVMLDAALCSVCEKEWSWSYYFCSQGHEKGLHYDPKSDAEDDWGYPLPLEVYDPNNLDKGVFCGREFDGGKDFFELSQVYLGAQYFAEVSDKVAALKGVDAEHPGAVTLTAQEVKELEPKKADPLSEARKAGYEIGLSPNGNAVWRDTDGLVWFYDMATETTSSLGRADSDWANSVAQLETDKVPSPTLSEDGGDPENKMEPNDKENLVSKTALLAASSEAKFPSELLEKIAEASDEEALKVFCTELGGILEEAASKVADAETKAAEAKELGDLGTAYIKALRQDVIDMYVKSHQDPADPQRVPTDTVMKLVDACGNNVELLKSLYADYLNTAQAKFPDSVSVRRSVHPDDPHRGADPADDKDATDAPTTGASRLHG
jgi:hypothetical protein